MSMQDCKILYAGDSGKTLEDVAKEVGCDPRELAVLNRGKRWGKTYFLVPEKKFAASSKFMMGMVLMCMVLYVWIAHLEISRLESHFET